MFIVPLLFHPNPKEMFDIQNPNTFLGGQNVHNLLILGALGYIIYKMR